jgi:hypothetical protein
MKVKAIIILTSLSFSCGHITESPIFEATQPEQETELKEIPKKLIGTYESLVDSAFLVITDKEVIIKNIRNPNVSIAELDSSERINLKDTIYREGKISMTVKVTADSVFQRILSFDTLYYSSDKYVIKKFHGYYFFNQRFRDKWVVRTLRLTDNGILISTLKSKEDIAALDDYSSIEPDSITYKTPTLDKLRMVLRDERFKDEWMFVRIEYGLQ